VVGLLTCGVAIAQQEQSKLHTLLDRISFNNAERPETLGKELASLSETELTKLCDMLVEPGTGDDTQARMALHGLTWYVGSEGTQAQRDRYVDVLCTGLDSDRPTEVKRFLIRQLQLAGNERAIEGLARCLHDGELGDAAAQALLGIGGEAGLAALVQAADGASGRTQATILAAIHHSGDTDALRRLAENIDLSDLPRESQQLMVDACAAFGRADLPAAAQTMHDLMREDSTGEERRAGTWRSRSQTSTTILELAESLANSKDINLAACLYRDLIAVYTDPEEVHVRCAALYGLASVLGADATADVVKALAAENPELRAAATEIAARLAGEGATDAFVRQLKTASADIRAAILTVLGRRGDESALPAALEALTDENKKVRIAAVKAAAQLGREKAIDPLVAFLDTEQADERKVAEDALVGMTGEAVSARIGAAVEAAGPRAQAALLDVLARRRARSHVNTALAFVNSDDEPVQIAAINAVGVLADQTAAPSLLALLKQTEAESVREVIEIALADICNRAESPESRAAPIIAAINVDDVRNYCSLLRVLGHIGGKPTVPMFRNAVADPREEVKETAIRALADWPNPTILDTALVLTFAHDAQELKHHVLAMRTFADFLARTGDEDVQTTLGLFSIAMREATRRDEERKLLLSKLAGIHDQRVLDTLAGYLPSGALGAEAAAATISVADGMLPDGWWPARAALEKVLDTVEGEAVRGRAQEVLDRIAEYEDFITDWLVSGPYTKPGKDGKAVFDIAFPPELPDAEGVEWKRQPRSRGAERWWHIDLTRSIGGDHRAAYLRTYVWSPTTQEALLELGSDDGIKVWLNGEVIHANNVPRGCARGQDRVPATLREGKNTLLMKVCNIGGGWGACARFRTPEGKRLRGLRIDAEARP
jgi:HEAT repeat protein